jgi:hypothetical protein
MVGRAVGQVNEGLATGWSQLPANENRHDPQRAIYTLALYSGNAQAWPTDLYLNACML